MNTYMETPRLILRDWREEDIPVFAGLNSINPSFLVPTHILSDDSSVK